MRTVNIATRQHHAVRLGAPRDLWPSATNATAPAILQRSDDDFVAAMLQQLRDETGRSTLRGQQAAARNRAQVLKLFQPVQRQFHLALVEAWCDTAGTPRLDPARVESAGLVVRRIRRDARGSSWYEGWVKHAGRLRGWARVERLGSADADPDPARRLARPGFSPSIDRAMQSVTLANPDALLDEASSPLFAAPPDVCAAAGRTVYYGIVPTTSSEIAAEPAPETETFGEAFGADSPDFISHLVGPLRGDADSFPLAGSTLQPAWFEAIEMPGDAPPAGIDADDWSTLGVGDARLRMHRFVLLLRQLASEFDAFGDSASGRAVYAELQRIALPLVLQPDEREQRSVAAGDFLRAANRVLLERDTDAPATAMIESWPALSATAASALRAALSTAVRERFAAVNGNLGRYDEPGAEYALRAFVRLKADAACPARTLWSGYSEAFVIAPWYEGAGAPPAKIALPDPFDRALLRSLKPNVAFVVPPALQGLLACNPKDLVDGKKCDSPMTIGWICSFSIPIITICAFIVLNIFLSLFDLIFQWMAFIKICIPFPKKGDGNG